MKRLRFFISLVLTAYLFTSVCVAQVTNVLPDGAKYVGELKDGLANGRGIGMWTNGMNYVGEFKDAE